MSYTVEIERVAAKALADMQRRDQERIIARLDLIADDPRHHGAVKLEGANAWRSRVGDFRIVYVIDDSVMLVTVTRIAHRSDVYRRGF